MAGLLRLLGQIRLLLMPKIIGLRHFLDGNLPKGFLRVKRLLKWKVIRLIRRVELNLLLESRD